MSGIGHTIASAPPSEDQDMALGTLSNSTGNRLLNRLPQDESEQLISRGQYVNFEQDEIIYRQGGPTSHVYFPKCGCCCHVVTLDEGHRVETTTIGNEGMLGFHLAFGLDWSPLAAVALVPGESLRVPTAAFLETMKEGEVLGKLIRRYAAYCIRFESQILACNSRHSVKQRACRRLLTAHDRVGNVDFSLTQELLGEMLGVRRQAVAAVAGTLQDAGVITYRRGVITILNRQRLEAASCECYKIIQTAYESIVMN
jgi:CRP-like cAMP-binding protein